MSAPSPFVALRLSSSPTPEYANINYESAMQALEAICLTPYGGLTGDSITPFGSSTQECGRAANVPIPSHHNFPDAASFSRWRSGHHKAVATSWACGLREALDAFTPTHPIHSTPLISHIPHTCPPVTQHPAAYEALPLHVGRQPDPLDARSRWLSFARVAFPCPVLAEAVPNDLERTTCPPTPPVLTNAVPTY